MPQTAGALALLQDTSEGGPWENAVAACLTVLCHRLRRRVNGWIDQNERIPSACLRLLRVSALGKTKPRFARSPFGRARPCGVLSL